MKAIISVIIPIYNVQEFLGEAIQSVLHQSYTALEIILVDDGSTDNSGKICDNYAALNPQIRVIHTKNGGISSARNKALDIAAGDYIMFLDSDDYLEPDAIETLYNNLVACDADMSVGSLRIVDEQSKEVYTDTLGMPKDIMAMDERSFWSFSLTKQSGVMVTNKLFKQYIWKTLRFIEGKIHEDDAALVNIMRQCSTIVCTNKISMNYRVRTGSIMQTPFSEKNLAKVAFLSERVNYFLEKGYFEYCYGAYFSGMQLISKAYLSSENMLIKRAKEEYESYRKLAKRLFPHAKYMSQKCSLLLFYLNLHIYTFVRYKFRPNDL